MVFIISRQCCNIYSCFFAVKSSEIQSTQYGETENPKIFTKFVALTSNKMLKMSKLREQLFNLVNAINNFNMTTDWPACFSINMCLKYLSLYKVLLLLLLLRSLKIDFLVRSPYATSQHRSSSRSRELSAKFAPQSFYNAVGCEKFNTSAS